MHKRVTTYASIALVALLISGCGSKENSKEVEKLRSENSSLKEHVKSLSEIISVENIGSDSSDSEKGYQPEAGNVKFGQEYIFKSESGEKLAGVTVISANQDFHSEAKWRIKEYPDEFLEGKPKANLVALTVKYTNYSLDAFRLFDDIKLYDDDGNQCHNNDYPENDDEVSAGHSGTATVYFVADKKFDEIKSFEAEFISTFEFSDSSVDGETEYRAKWSIA